VGRVVIAVDVGVGLAVAVGVPDAVGVTVGFTVGVAVLVGVAVGEPVGVGVGLRVGVGVVVEGVEIVNDNEQLPGEEVLSALGRLLGTFGATGSCLSWKSL